MLVSRVVSRDGTGGRSARSRPDEGAQETPCEESIG
jgi:hypothetical protein